MNSYALTHLSDRVLLHDLAQLVLRERVTTAELLAHIAEVDERRLYLPAAYPSMFAYCVGELRLSEDSASKRIHAARAARQFPVIFGLLAEGRLHLGAVCLLAPYLTSGNAEELAKAASHKTKSEIELLLAQRFPRTELMELVQPLAAPAGFGDQHAPGHVAGHDPDDCGRDGGEHAPGHVENAGLLATLTPIAAQRFALQVTVDQRTYDDLRQAQALLGHEVPSGDLAKVLSLALRSFVQALENRKFAATDRPQRTLRHSKGPRHIPAHVKRAVWERDGGQCTFVSDSGNRCPARTRLEFDHELEVARGGEASVDQLRVRCRAHNQFTAEQTFGAGFMERKREEARDAARTRKAAARALAVEARTAAALARRSAVEARAQTREAETRVDSRNVIPWLRHLGFRPEEARRAADYCESVPDASLEERVRVALAWLRPGARSGGGVARGSAMGG